MALEVGALCVARWLSIQVDHGLWIAWVADFVCVCTVESYVDCKFPDSWGSRSRSVGTAGRRRFNRNNACSLLALTFGKVFIILFNLERMIGKQRQANTETRIVWGGTYLGAEREREIYIYIYTHTYCCYNECLLCTVHLAGGKKRGGCDMGIL